MTKKIISSSIVSLAALALSAGSVLAHVAVQPAQVGVAARQDFSMGVPNEKEIPTTQVRLVIPEGLENVTPYVKPGWKIQMQKTGEGEGAKVTEITWSGGEIAEGLRDSFTFRAVTPSDEVTLQWKAYQTYSDGTVVSWDQAPTEGEEESETSGPYSETKVVNDLAGGSDSSVKAESDQMLTWVAYGALLLAAVSLALSLRSLMPKQ